MTQLHRFARRHGTLRRRTGDRGHRTREVGGAADRRHRELDGAFAIWPDDAFEAEPQRRRITGERQFDGFAGQRLAFPGEFIQLGQENWTVFQSELLLGTRDRKPGRKRFGRVMTPQCPLLARDAP